MFKVLIEFVTISLLLFMFWFFAHEEYGIPSSPTGDWTCAPLSEGDVSATRPPGKSPSCHFYISGSLYNLRAGFHPRSSVGRKASSFTLHRSATRYSITTGTVSSHGRQKSEQKLRWKFTLFFHLNSNTWVFPSEHFSMCTFKSVSSIIKMISYGTHCFVTSFVSQPFPF